ncbi:MAG: hypothetical protein KKF44_00950 [Nanoarchaeota archaeon]|nr:hypothetical protein [Nanoarchaeota archaeon]
MADARRIIIIFVIAVLFSIFVNVSIDAFYNSPDYMDYCNNNERVMPKTIPNRQEDCKEMIVPSDKEEECQSNKGYITYTYDQYGCASGYYCETCQNDYDDAREKYGFVVFIISAITGLAAFFSGLNLPIKKNSVNEWVGSGFLLGGLFTIFIGTGRYFGDMGRTMRPFVIFFELLLVLYFAYKKLGDNSAKKKK